MTHKLVELTPNQQFIDTQFNGYKLSLDPIPILETKLDTAVDRIVPDSSQYSFLHAKLFALHNHLVGETIDNIEFVYFVDESWCIKKAFVDNVSLLVQVLEMIKIPQITDKTPIRYNNSLKLVNESLALFSNGAGKIYILETGNRLLHYPWKHLSTIQIIDSSQFPFIIQDARFLRLTPDIEEIHCLLYRIEQVVNQERFANAIYWIKLEKQNEIWKISETKKLVSTVNALVDYAYLEPTCEALYIISSGHFTFVQESGPLTETTSRTTSHKKYCWCQTLDDITINIKIPDNCSIDSINVNSQLKRIRVSFNEQTVLNGELSHEIDESLTNWSIQNNSLLEVQLYKKEEHIWTNLIPGDNSGEYIVTPSLAAEIHEKLSYLCSEHEVLTSSGTTFNSQEIEECDFESNEYLTFERLSRFTNETTHKINISTHNTVLIVERNVHLPPSVALRHDVDAYIWQPINEEETFSLRHEGTLNAFGYVQASKQQRKFSVCAPNLSYCAISETTRHILLYRQCKAICSGELRNRKTRKSIEHIAQQHVITLPDEEIFGIYAANLSLFVLTFNHIYVLTL